MTLKKAIDNLKPGQYVIFDTVDTGYQCATKQECATFYFGCEKHAYLSTDGQLEIYH